MKKAKKTLQELLRERHITQAELGKKLGFSESQISLLVNGRRRMSLEVAAQIAALLGVGLRTILLSVSAAKEMADQRLKK